MIYERKCGAEESYEDKTEKAKMACELSIRWKYEEMHMWKR